MKILLAACNAKYIHSNLAVYNLKSCSGEYSSRVVVKEYTINQIRDDILKDIYLEQPDVVCFSCYIWNLEFVQDIAADLYKVLPDLEIWGGGPEVSYDAEKFLAKHPEFRGIMKGEGERTFCELAGLFGADFFRGKGSLLRAKKSTVPGGTLPRLRCYACCRARLPFISKSTLSQEVFTKFPHSIKKAQSLLVFQKRSAPFFVVRTGPAYCRGRSLPAPAAGVPVWSDSTAEIPAPAHCQGPGPRS